MYPSLDQAGPQAFPTLTDAQVALLRPFGQEHRTSAGEVLFRPGNASYKLVVVLEGRTCVSDDSDGERRIIKESGPGEFVAELGILSGQQAFLTCEVTEAGRVLLLPPGRVRDVIRTIPELADILITAFLIRREMLMTTAAATLVLVGYMKTGRALELREFVDRNRIPHRWLRPDDPDVPAMLDHPWYAVQDPIRTVRAVIRGKKVLTDPSVTDLARALGLDLGLDQPRPADMIVVGTGPAGLAAAVYGASEGLETIVIDDVAIGGQAGTSSRIENYLGFPNGISGGALAFKAQVQALKFGARIAVPRRAVGLVREEDGYCLTLDDGTRLRGRSVVIATGARYRKLGLPEQGRFEGAGIYYSATALEARLCEGQPVVVVGAGNSAGQAAMFLAQSAAKVYLLARGASLAASMSSYLVNRLEATPGVEIRTRTQVQELHGSYVLDGVTVGAGDGGREHLPTRAVFAMIGADPCTDWLTGTVDLDDRGFVRTGLPWEGALAPSPFTTSLPGVFAVGDVRSGSVKRVASAVGEGSVVVQAVHQWLAAHPVAGDDGRRVVTIDVPRQEVAR